VRNLLQAQASQRVIKEQRQQLQREITVSQKQVIHFQTLQEQLAQQQEQLDDLNGQRATLVERQKALQQQSIAPLHARLDAQTAELPDLLTVMAETDITQLSQNLKHYLQDMQRWLTQYRDIQENQQHLSEDVQIVTDMRQELDTRIDKRTQGPMVGRFRAGLHQDNQEVHATGAAKMNQRYDALEQQRLALLQTHADLKRFLDQADLWETLHQASRDLIAFLKQLAALQQQVDQVTNTTQVVAQTVTRTQQTLATDFPDFDVAQQTAQITALQQRLDALVVDPQLDQKLATAQALQASLQADNLKLERQRATQQEISTTTAHELTELAAELTALAERTVTALTDLTPYMPADTRLQQVTDALTFSQEHASEIRNHRFSELTDKIGRLIHNNNENGVDPYALDSTFEERQHAAIASAMRQERSVNRGDLRVVPFDITTAEQLMAADETAVGRSLEQSTSGNEVAQQAYLSGVTYQISAQYGLIADYNQILSQGVRAEQGIHLRVSLVPVDVDAQVIQEARDLQLAERPALVAEIQKRLNKLASDVTIANDDEKFMAEAYRLLDVRQWSSLRSRFTAGRVRPGCSRSWTTSSFNPVVLVQRRPRRWSYHSYWCRRWSYNGPMRRTW